jgi:hypothetical protein
MRKNKLKRLKRSLRCPNRLGLLSQERTLIVDKELPLLKALVKSRA